ncbi:MAG: PD-(D/E)XK nuclease family protein, partial [Gammaproteobacteria bacterium]|nr:PD-(D/E)XK nuclease family protein [Gammaproteobacteria bacterium]
QFLEKRKQQQNRENANLLYVAITRAKQYLYISACEPRPPYIDWYRPVRMALENIGTESDDGKLVYQFGSAAEYKPPTVIEAAPPVIEIDPALQQKMPPLPPMEKIIAPSYTAKDAILQPGADDDAQLRGIVIHRCLELLSREFPFSDNSIKQCLMNESAHLADEQKLQHWLEEARQIIAHPELEIIFKPAAGTKIYNELPIQYRLDKQLVRGVIDRLLVSDDTMLLIDYKTHQQATTDNIKELAHGYREQMQLYANGIQQIWPEKTLQTALLFTSCHSLVYLE